MSWADKKIKEYKNGAVATFLEKRNLEHANPLLFTLLLIGISIIAGGLWEHSWMAIVIGGLVCFLGHVYVWTKK
jgi:1,4-dihydroxy-2-naphthoate octaprenyltransferase